MRPNDQLPAGATVNGADVAFGLPVMPGGVSVQAAENALYLHIPSEFWGEYTLAKKP